MRVLEFLQQYEGLSIYSSRILAKIEVLESQATKTTSIISGERVSGGRANSSDIVERYIMQKQAYKIMLEKLMDKELEIENFLDKLENQRHRSVLAMAYIDCMKTKDIARIMKCTTRNVEYIKQRALIEAEALYNKESPKPKPKRGRPRKERFPF